MSTSHPGRLPHEIVVMILGYLEKPQDMNTLKSCSLVHRDWTRPAQGRRLSYLDIELHPSYYARIPNLLQLFQNSSYLALSTRSLCLCFDTSSGRVDDDVQAQVAALVDLLTRVDRLCLIDTEQDPPGFVAPALLEAVHRRVNSGTLRYFALSGWCLYDVHQFIKIPEAGRSAQLPTLELSSISPDAEPNTSGEAAVRLAFDKLIIDDTSFDVVSRILGSAPQSFRAQAISISNVWHDHEEVLALISPDTLEELSLSHLQGEKISPSASLGWLTSITQIVTTKRLT